MTSIGLNLGLKALLSAQTALDTVGQNITNASTPGYSRQSVLLSASSPLLIRGNLQGGGVEIDGIVRTVDELLDRRILSQVSSLGGFNARLGALEEVESLFGEPGDYGVAALLSGFFGSVSDLSAQPADGALRAGVVQSTDALAARIRELYGGVSQIGDDLIPQASAQVDRLNSLAAQAANLNVRIAETEHAGNAANDLRDQRTLVLKEMAQLAEVRTHENEQGHVRVTVGGHLLVGATQAHEAALQLDDDGEAALFIGSSDQPVKIRGGSIGALLELQGNLGAGLGGDLDEFAHGLILEVNRAHSTGVPTSGPFHQLTGTFAVEDLDGDGSALDEPLGDLGLPFEIADGSLYVSVTDEATGAVVTHEIEVDPASMTVGGLITAFDDLPHLSASLDGAGRMQVRAEQGYGFDFSARLDTLPNEAGTFGGGQASLGTGGAGPFALADGATLDLVGPGGPFTVTFSSTDFADVNAATAQEIAAVVNADAGAIANGLHAVSQGDRLFLQTQGTGASETFQVAGGSALGTLGWTAGTTVTGSDEPVEVTISGAYTGSNGRWTFVPSGDGTVGETPGLQVSVFDEGGTLVATLDVGADYAAGEQIEIGEGVFVALGHGELSASENDALALDVVGDSDSTDLLVAFGINSLLTGSSAQDIAVRADIVGDPDLLATSTSGAVGENAVLLALLGAQNHELADSGGRTLSEFYGDIVGGIGFEVEGAANARDVEHFLVQSLEQRRDQVSGVNLDEELVDLIQFEQAYAAAAQFIQVVNSLNDEILSLI